MPYVGEDYEREPLLAVVLVWLLEAAVSLCKG